MNEMNSQLHKVVIVGGGFGGLHAARALRHAPVEVTLVDKRNFHLFQPLLYQVATGALSPANIAAPLRSILRCQRKTRVLLGEVAGLDPVARKVLLSDRALPYDTLILAAGAQDNYYGQPAWREFAPGLKTLEDATEIRRRVLNAFEQAERCTDPAERAAWLTFVIAGAGPTGVELAGAIAEIARHTLRQDFRSIDPAAARVLLVEQASRPLSAFPPDLADSARIALARLRVELLTGAVVRKLSANGVSIELGVEQAEIRTRTVLWAAGVKAAPLSQAVAAATGCLMNPAGKLFVQQDLSLPGYPEIFAIGDLAACIGPSGEPLPGTAPVAMQQGAFAGRMIAKRLAGLPTGKFRYRHYGAMATIGRCAAVAELGRVHLAGMPGWLAWLFIHLLYIVQFENKLLVLLQWAWSYFTWGRSARLITYCRHDLQANNQPASRDKTQ